MRLGQTVPNFEADTTKGPLNNQTGALPKCILCEENILEAS